MANAEPVTMAGGFVEDAEAQARFAHQTFAESEAVGHAGHAEERVHRARWRHCVDAGNRGELAQQEVARSAKARERVQDCRFALRDRHHAGALHEHRRARGEVAAHPKPS